MIVCREIQVNNKSVTFHARVKLRLERFDVTGSDTLSNSLNMAEGIESLSIRDHCANDPDRFQVYEVNPAI